MPFFHLGFWYVINHLGCVERLLVMYKNQFADELLQLAIVWARPCSQIHIFKATVNFNGEILESPNYCSTLRQAEHSATKVALNTLSRRGPYRCLATKVPVTLQKF